MRPIKNGDPTKTDQRVLDYLASRGVDTSYLGEIPTTRILPTRGRSIGNPHGFAGAYMPEAMGEGMIALSPTRATDPQMRMEEILHALQDERLVYPSLSGKINKLAGRLGVTEESPFEDRYAVMNVLPDDPNRQTRESRDIEAEAKLLSLKIDMIDKGLINNSGDVSEEDLYRIQEYMMGQAEAPREQRSGAEYFLQPYFRNLDDDKTRKLLLKIMNKI